jgi:hypothetical protein
MGRSSPELRQGSAGDGGLLALRDRSMGDGLKPPHAALAEDRRGERCGKGALEASGGEQGDDCRVTCRELKDDIRTGLGSRIRDKPGGCPCIGQAVSGIEMA